MPEDPVKEDWDLPRIMQVIWEWLRSAWRVREPTGAHYRDEVGVPPNPDTVGDCSRTHEEVILHVLIQYSDEELLVNFLLKWI